VVYGYARAFVSGLAALTAALIYATMGQVLQIGRMGESEAVFALLVSASLLLWHLGYSMSWPPIATWCIGFGFAALAALVKGPQAPVYFVAITTAYLFVRRDWRYLFGLPFVAGALVFAAIIAAWLIPFYRATNWDAVTATWSGLATDRIRLTGLIEHLALYPLETFVCLLPWSPLLVALANRETRKLLEDQKPLVAFLVVAIAVAYPSVWIAAGARGRYFMPLYPLVAVLIALIIDRCSVAAIGSYPRRAWHQFLLLWGTVVGTGGLAIAAISLMAAEFAGELRTQQSLGLATAALAMVTVVALWRAYRQARPLSRVAATAAIAMTAGFAYVGLMINVHVARWNDPAAAVARVQQMIPASQPIASLTAIDHRFAYFYKSPIAELDWPLAADDLPLGVEYFCFMRHPNDTAEAREAGRGRRWTKTPGTLPFAWEELATLCVERRLRDRAQSMVVIGRVLRPRQAIVSDATVPQRSSINLTAATIPVEVVR
jgi:4-amino-4-deoxy-L-arabinose transferase-like glycosyltransferase